MLTRARDSTRSTTTTTTTITTTLNTNNRNNHTHANANNNTYRHVIHLNMLNALDYMEKYSFSCLCIPVRPVTKMITWGCLIVNFIYIYFSICLLVFDKYSPPIVEQLTWIQTSYEALICYIIKSTAALLLLIGIKRIKPNYMLPFMFVQLFDYLSTLYEVFCREFFYIDHQQQNGQNGDQTRSTTTMFATLQYSLLFMVLNGILQFIVFRCYLYIKKCSILGCDTNPVQLFSTQHQPSQPQPSHPSHQPPLYNYSIIQDPETGTGRGSRGRNSGRGHSRGPGGSSSSSSYITMPTSPSSRQSSTASASSSTTTSTASSESSTSVDIYNRQNTITTMDTINTEPPSYEEAIRMPSNAPPDYMTAIGCGGGGGGSEQLQQQPRSQQPLPQLQPQQQLQLQQLQRQLQRQLRQQTQQRQYHQYDNCYVL